jgi:ABC-type Fe3+-hydroxamate transport system substrate-binding protein
MKPDLVIVDAEENRREDYEDLIAAGLDVYVLHIQSLCDVNDSMSALARRLEVTWEPLDLSQPTSPRLRALVPIWRRPWMALGQPTYGASLLEYLGVTCLFSEIGRYPSFSLDDVRQENPDVVLAPSEPYPFTSRQVPELSNVAPVTLLDGKDLFWWGSRTRGALSRLAENISLL